MKIDSDHKYQENQLLLFFRNSFNNILFNSITYFFLFLHCVLIPFEIPFLFCVHSVLQLKVILTIVYNDLIKLFDLFKLDLELLKNLYETQKRLLFVSKDSEECQKKNLVVYSRIKEILRHFQILPLTPREAILNFLLLQKVPSFIWKYLLPYPKFIFEDTFSNAVISDGRIVVTLPRSVPVTAVVMKNEVRECYVLNLQAREYFEALKNISTRENEKLE